MTDTPVMQFFSGEWTDSDGTVWLSRKLIDPQFSKSKKYPHITWPRLGQLRVDPGEKVPGKIRAKHVIVRVRSALSPDGAEKRVWVYHADDTREAAAPTVKERFQKTERQQAASGKHRGEWFIASRLVGKLLGIGKSAVTRYRQEGFPWMPGGKPGTYRKPVALQFRDAGRSEWFVREQDVLDAKAALDAVPEKPEGLVPVTRIKGHSLTTLSKRMGRVKATYKTYRMERRNGKPRKVPYVLQTGLIPEEDLKEFEQSHFQQERPTNTLTVREVAELFGWSETHVLGTFPKPSRRKGRLVCRYRTRDGKSRSAVREVFFISVEAVKRVWSQKRDGPCPLAMAAAPEQTAASRTHQQIFIPTLLQEQILKTLDGKAMTADALESALKLDRRRLYYGNNKNGLTDLQQRGLIANNRKVGGYYRPDSPPPKYLKYMREQQIN